MVGFWLSARPASDAAVERIEAGFDRYGYGLWALARLDTGEFLGFAGVQWIPFEADFPFRRHVLYRLPYGRWVRLGGPPAPGGPPSHSRLRAP